MTYLPPRLTSAAIASAEHLAAIAKAEGIPLAPAIAKIPSLGGTMIVKRKLNLRGR